MKRAVTTIMMLILSFSIAAAQDTARTSEDESGIRTIFAKKKDFKAEIGYFIGPEFGYTQFESNRDVFMAGLSMGVTFNHWFSVGLSGYGVANSGNLHYNNIIYDSVNKTWQGGKLYGGYGGLLLEFTAFPKSMVHITFPVLIGGGGFAYEQTEHNNYNWNWETLDWDAYFVVQPGVKVEFNIVKFFRIGIGASYRYIPDLDLVNTPSSLANQFNANLSLKFGKF